MEQNHSLKARMYLGGLKSLFADMHDMIEGVEKTGNMPGSMLQNLVDVKEAIDLTLQQLKKATVQCCEHDDSCEDEDEDEELYCEDCDLSLADCDCEEEDYEQEEDDEEEEPEPEPKTATRKPSKKEKVVVPSPTVTPVPASKKNKKETRH
jgi:hypothetical protein